MIKENLIRQAKNHNNKRKILSPTLFKGRLNLERLDKINLLSQSDFYN